jgi:hypothetical protein
MKIRNIKKTFDPVYNLRYKNLIVGGCSFTYNNSDQHICTWPYYLKDYGNFQNVYDFSLVGGGNTHTFNALIYGLENTPNILDDSLIIIQIAGFDRDEYIVAPEALNDYPFSYFYESNAAAGITGGESIANFKNKDSIEYVKNIKNYQCRSIENFTRLLALNSYLTVINSKFMFFEYRDYSLPGRDKNFDIRKYLPTQLSNKYESIVSTIPMNFYKFCVTYGLLEDDDFHPSREGHRRWTLEHLLPYVIDHHANKI